jgi:dihydrofolate synthase/folylpolyglutamate synthase
MLYFALQNVDVAILEVGMGGRLDAVNVYDADAVLIASVDLDHQDYLGPDRETIGREKAGIFRLGRPAIIADADPPRSVVAEAAARGARASYAGRDFGVVPVPAGLAYRRPGIAARIFPRPPFGGPVQLINAAACITVADSLQDVLPVSDAAIGAGISATRISGRFERCVVNEVEWLFDVAHNPAAAALYRESLDTLLPVRQTHAVFGAMGDKDLCGVLRLFVADVDAWFVCAVDSDRGASVEQIKNVLDGLSAGPVRAYADAVSACNAARAQARPGDRVLVFGSFYTVGPAMAALGLYCPPLSAV